VLLKTIFMLLGYLIQVKITSKIKDIASNFASFHYQCKKLLTNISRRPPMLVKMANLAEILLDISTKLASLVQQVYKKNKQDIVARQR
jgi:hypothetical protein